MDQELISYLDKRFGEIDRRFGEIDQRFAGVDRRFDDLRTEFRTEIRQVGVTVEGLRTQIQIVAEGVSSLSERLDRVEQNLREEILCSQRELSAMIKFSYAELDRRIIQLEASTHNLEARVARLEAART